MDFMVHIILGFAELPHSLAQTLCKLGQLLGAKHDENDDKNNDHVRSGKVGEKRNRVHKSLLNV